MKLVFPRSPDRRISQTRAIGKAFMISDDCADRGDHRPSLGLRSFEVSFTTEKFPPLVNSSM